MLTVATSKWLTIRIIPAISAAASMHRVLLSEAMEGGSRFLSALKMAAWWRQMVDVWMFMFRNTIFAFANPAGNLR